MKLTVVFLTLCVAFVSGQLYEDNRCFCICLSVGAVMKNNLSNDRLFFKEALPAAKCNCDNMVVPKLGALIKGREHQFCQRCDCKFEKRNTTMILVVVVGILWVLVLLFVYMVFIFCLDPWTHSQKDEYALRKDDEESQVLLDSENYDED